MEETKRTKSQSKIDRFWNNPTDPRPKLEAESHKKRTRQRIDRANENRGLLIRKTDKNEKRKITEWTYTDYVKALHDEELDIKNILKEEWDKFMCEFNKEQIKISS